MACITLHPGGERKEVSDRMAKLVDQFYKEYEFIYEAQADGAYVAGYDEALEFGDKLIADHHSLVTEFNKAREDLLTSDREVAAFAFAATELGYV